MPHEKVYAVCEDMCLEETMIKSQIQDLVKIYDCTVEKVDNGLQQFEDTNTRTFSGSQPTSSTTTANYASLTGTFSDIWENTIDVNLKAYKQDDTQYNNFTVQTTYPSSSSAASTYPQCEVDTNLNNFWTYLNGDSTADNKLRFFAWHGGTSGSTTVVPVKWKFDIDMNENFHSAILNFVIGTCLLSSSAGSYVAVYESNTGEYWDEIFKITYPNSSFSGEHAVELSKRYVRFEIFMTETNSSATWYGNYLSLYGLQITNLKRNFPAYKNEFTAEGMPMICENQQVSFTTPSTVDTELVTLNTLNDFVLNEFLQASKTYEGRITSVEEGSEAVSVKEVTDY